MALVTVDEYKASRGISGDDYDARIGGAIDTASARVREYCGRDTTNGFELDSRTEVYSGSGIDTLRLREWPVASVESVAYLSSVSDGAASYESAIDSSSYYADERGNLYLTGSVSWAWEHGGKSRGVWAKGDRNIRVSYTAGYSEIPDNLKEAVMILCDSWFLTSQRDVVTLNQEARGVDSRQYSATTEVTSRVLALLAPWRRPYA